jgi:hypothetical protein
MNPAVAEFDEEWNDDPNGFFTARKSFFVRSAFFPAFVFTIVQHI